MNYLFFLSILVGIFFSENSFTSITHDFGYYTTDASIFEPLENYKKNNQRRTDFFALTQFPFFHLENNLSQFFYESDTFVNFTTNAADIATVNTEIENFDLFKKQWEKTNITRLFIQQGLFFPPSLENLITEKNLRPTLENITHKYPNPENAWRFILTENNNPSLTYIVWCSNLSKEPFNNKDFTLNILKEQCQKGYTRNINIFLENLLSYPCSYKFDFDKKNEQPLHIFPGAFTFLNLTSLKVLLRLNIINKETRDTIWTSRETRNISLKNHEQCVNLLKDTQNIIDFDPDFIFAVCASLLHVPHDTVTTKKHNDLLIIIKKCIESNDENIKKDVLAFLIDSFRDINENFINTFFNDTTCANLLLNYVDENKDTILHVIFKSGRENHINILIENLHIKNKTIAGRRNEEGNAPLYYYVTHYSQLKDQTNNKIYRKNQLRDNAFTLLTQYEFTDQEKLFFSTENNISHLSKSHKKILSKKTGKEFLNPSTRPQKNHEKTIDDHRDCLNETKPLDDNKTIEVKIEEISSNSDKKIIKIHDNGTIKTNNTNDKQNQDQTQHLAKIKDATVLTEDLLQILKDFPPEKSLKIIIQYRNNPELPNYKGKIKKSAIKFTNLDIHNQRLVCDMCDQELLDGDCTDPDNNILRNMVFFKPCDKSLNVKLEHTNNQVKNDTLISIFNYNNFLSNPNLHNNSQGPEEIVIKNKNNGGSHRGGFSSTSHNKHFNQKTTLKKLTLNALSHYIQIDDILIKGFADLQEEIGIEKVKEKIVSRKNNIKISKINFATLTDENIQQSICNMYSLGLIDENCVYMNDKTKEKISLKNSEFFKQYKENKEKLNKSSDNQKEIEITIKKEKEENNNNNIINENPPKNIETKKELTYQQKKEKIQYFFSDIINNLSEENIHDLFDLNQHGYYVLKQDFKENGFIKKAFDDGVNWFNKNDSFLPQQTTNKYNSNLTTYNLEAQQKELLLKLIKSGFIQPTFGNILKISVQKKDEDYWCNSCLTEFINFFIEHVDERQTRSLIESCFKLKSEGDSALRQKFLELYFKQYDARETLKKEWQKYNIGNSWDTYLKGTDLNNETELEELFQLDFPLNWFTQWQLIDENNQRLVHYIKENKDKPVEKKKIVSVPPKKLDNKDQTIYKNSNTEQPKDTSENIDNNQNNVSTVDTKSNNNPVTESILIDNSKNRNEGEKNNNSNQNKLNGDQLYNHKNNNNSISITQKKEVEQHKIGLMWSEFFGTIDITNKKDNVDRLLEQNELDTYKRENLLDSNGISLADYLEKLRGNNIVKVESKSNNNLNTSNQNNNVSNSHQKTKQITEKKVDNNDSKNKTENDDAPFSLGGVCDKYVRYTWENFEMQQCKPDREINVEKYRNSTHHVMMACARTHIAKKIKKSWGNFTKKEDFDNFKVLLHYELINPLTPDSTNKSLWVYCVENLHIESINNIFTADLKLDYFNEQVEVTQEIIETFCKKIDTITNPPLACRAFTSIIKASEKWLSAVDSIPALEGINNAQIKKDLVEVLYEKNILKKLVPKPVEKIEIKKENNRNDKNSNKKETTAITNTNNSSETIKIKNDNNTPLSTETRKAKQKRLKDNVVNTFFKDPFGENAKAFFEENFIVENVSKKCTLNDQNINEENQDFFNKYTQWFNNNSYEPQRRQSAPARNSSESLASINDGDQEEKALFLVFVRGGLIQPSYAWILKTSVEKHKTNDWWKKCLQEFIYLFIENLNEKQTNSLIEACFKSTHDLQLKKDFIKIYFEEYEKYDSSKKQAWQKDKIHNGTYCWYFPEEKIKEKENNIAKMPKPDIKINNKDKFICEPKSQNTNSKTNKDNSVNIGQTSETNENIIIKIDGIKKTDDETAPDIKNEGPQENNNGNNSNNHVNIQQAHVQNSQANNEGSNNGNNKDPDQNNVLPFVNPVPLNQPGNNGQPNNHQPQNPINNNPVEKTFLDKIYENKGKTIGSVVLTVFLYYFFVHPLLMKKYFPKQSIT